MSGISWKLDRVTPTDCTALVELHTDSKVRRYLGGPLDSTAALETARMYSEGKASGLHWAVREASAFTLIGLVSITPHHDKTDSELSYQFSRKYHGLGVAYPSISAILAKSKEYSSHSTLIAETQSLNAPSIKLLEKLGMKYERSVERFGATQLIYRMNFS